VGSKLESPLRNFLRTETGSAAVLLAAAVAALGSSATARASLAFARRTMRAPVPDVRDEAREVSVVIRAAARPRSGS
jgi:hypothetical protein